MTLQWQYFFGGCSGNHFDRYYKTEINGIRVEKHSNNRGSKYAVGNIDEAKKKFKTEKELIEFVTPHNHERERRNCPLVD